VCHTCLTLVFIHQKDKWMVCRNQVSIIGEKTIGAISIVSQQTLKILCDCRHEHRLNCACRRQTLLTNHTPTALFVVFAATGFRALLKMMSKIEINFWTTECKASKSLSIIRHTLQAEEIELRERERGALLWFIMRSKTDTVIYTERKPSEIKLPTTPNNYIRDQTTNHPK